MVVVTYSVAKITFVGVEKTFKDPVITSVVDQDHFCSGCGWDNF